MNKLEKEKVKKLAQWAFNQADTEKTGQLSYVECKKVFQILLPSKDIDESLFSDQFIKFDEFLRIISLMIDNYEICF